MDEPEGVDRHAVLAAPARARILELVRSASEPVTAHQLAADLGLHVTTVRFHLDQLAQAGLVVGETEPSNRRGRPSIGYRAGLLDLAEVREQMIDALADALADRGSRDRSLAAGRRWADRLPELPSDPVTAVTTVFAQLGFSPDLGDAEVRLRRCPFGDAARRTPEVVCRVHLGLAQGIARRAARSDGRPDGRVHVELLPFAEPDACLLTFTGASTAQKGSASS